MVDIDAVKRRFESLLPAVDERMRRLIAAAESLAIDYGGVSIVSRATGVSRRAIARGIVELGNPPVPSGGAIRKPGGGRKRTAEQDETLVRDLGFWCKFVKYMYLSGERPCRFKRPGPRSKFSERWLLVRLVV
jgi:DNA-binding phage protein